MAREGGAAADGGLGRSRGAIERGARHLIALDELIDANVERPAPANMQDEQSQIASDRRDNLSMAPHCYWAPTARTPARREADDVAHLRQRACDSHHGAGRGGTQPRRGSCAQRQSR